MVHNEGFSEWSKIHAYILQLENEGLVTRTFRRLDPERQREIILAILSEAASKGPTQVNIKSVAERANSAVGTLYTYFNNREGMLEFAVEMVTRFILQEMESYHSFLVSLPFRQGLQAYLSGGVEWSQIFASFVQLFARAAYQGDPDLQERLVRPVADLLRGIIQDMLAKAIERGEVRASIDTEATARVLHALTIAIGDSQLLPYLNTYFQVMDDHVSIDRTMDAMLAMVMRGLTNDH